MNLSFLEEADARYKKNHNGESAHYPEVLKDAGYIRYLPQDFQRDTEKNNEIRYRYDEERKRWDVRLSIIGRQD
jgi:hypothetical protein